MQWAEQSNILPPTQSGFRKNKSCHDQILRLNQSIINGFNNKMRTGAIFFDLEKAFDKASHTGILFKLHKANLNPHLLNWIKNFLEERTFFVTWNSKNSRTHQIKTGVPQGSCISPTLFNIYFSDIARSIPKNIAHAMFADDLCIWYNSKSKKQIKKNLQIGIDSIETFCNEWGFKLNSKKTLYTMFTTAGHRKSYKKVYEMKLKIQNKRIPLDPFPIFLIKNPT